MDYIHMLMVDYVVQPNILPEKRLLVLLFINSSPLKYEFSLFKVSWKI